MNYTNPENIVEVLKNDLLNLGIDGTRDLLIIEKAIGVCSCALMELREYVNLQGFKTQEEEIYFFKVTKTYVPGEYLYYSKLFEIEIRRPVTTTRAQKKYLKKMISQAQLFLMKIPNRINIIGTGQPTSTKSVLSGQKRLTA